MTGSIQSVVNGSRMIQEKAAASAKRSSREVMQPAAAGVLGLGALQGDGTPRKRFDAIAYVA
jgi:hypothetical protein